VIGRGQECAVVQTPQFWTFCDLGLYRAGCLSCYTLLLISLRVIVLEGYVTSVVPGVAVLIIHWKKIDF
jgi:hypothetical protein